MPKYKYYVMDLTDDNSIDGFSKEKDAIDYALSHAGFEFDEEKEIIVVQVIGRIKPPKTQKWVFVKEK